MSIVTKIKTVISGIWMIATAVREKAFYTTRPTKLNDDLQMMGMLEKYFKVLPGFETKRPADKWEMLDMVGTQVFTGHIAKMSRPIIHFAQFELHRADIFWMIKHYAKNMNPEKQVLEVMFKHKGVMNISLLHLKQDDNVLDLGMGPDSKLHPFLKHGFLLYDDQEHFPKQYTSYIDIGVNTHHIVLDLLSNKAYIRLMCLENANDYTSANRYIVQFEGPQDTWEQQLINGFNNYLTENCYAKGNFTDLI